MNPTQGQFSNQLWSVKNKFLSETLKTMRLPNCLILGLLALTACSSHDFKPLYNGKDLSGWHIKDSKFQNWKANGEILLCEKGEKGIANGNGWLTTDKEYGDFALQLEWKIPANGNTGVAIHYPKDGEPAHEGIEVQMLDDASQENASRPPEELSGSLYADQPPLRKADKPVGEWNKTEITSKDSMLTVKTNGVETLKLNLDELTVLHGHHTQYKPVSQWKGQGGKGLPA